MKTAFKNHFFAIALSLIPAVCFGQNYQVVPKSNTDTGIRFDLPYSAGIHHGFSSQLTGDVEVELNPIAVHAVNLEIPIASMTTGDTTRDCHMREALGIDYTHSQFPNKHVCDSNHQLPATGPDSVAFPNISLTLLSVDPGQLIPGITTMVNAAARMSIHGVTRELTIPLQLLLASDGSQKIHVSSSFPVSLSEYGVQVKPFLFISVSDQATVKIDLDLK